MDCFVAKNVNAPRNDGFTLAEVLITLVIIGVIAAVTVPTLITKYQKEQTLSQLKKVYSVLSQTTNKAISDNGPINTWEVTSYQNTAFIEKYLAPYLNIMKKCAYNTDGTCAFKFKNIVNGQRIDDELSNAIYRFILNDGSMVGVYCLAGENSAYCYIIVDINGQKKPNIAGRDVFHFIYFTKAKNNPERIGKLISMYTDKEREILINCCKNGEGVGQSWYNTRACTALIMKDGWRIADDYPW